MTNEEKIKEALLKKFSFLDGAINIVRARRMSIDVELDNFMPVFSFLATDMQLTHLCTITGLDEGERLGFIYHLTGDSRVMVNLKTSVIKSNPVINTVTSFFPGAEIYEREVSDLFGAVVDGLPKGNRYPLTDDWPKGEYPLRKEWKLTPEMEKELDKNA